MNAAQIGHHRAHHSTGKAAREQQGTHHFVLRIDEAAQPFVDEFLGEGACFHVGAHVDFGHVEARVLEHAAHRNDIRVYLAPGKRLDGGVDDVGSVLAHLQDGGHAEARARVSMVLDNDFGVLVLNHFRELTKECRLADAGHIFQANLLGAGCNFLVGQLGIVLKRVHGRGGDAECALRCHAGFLGPTDGRSDVSDVVQAVEDARDVHALGVFHAVHHGAYVVGHGIHTEGVEAAVEHMGLDAHLVERLAECPHGIVGVLAGQQLHLLEGAAIGFHAGETTHIDNHRGDALQLILAWLELARALPHVPIDETELNFLAHYFFNYCCLNCDKGVQRLRKRPRRANAAPLLRLQN